jgi:hypothetical protein
MIAWGIKVPRHVRIVADVPRTPGPQGDKVQKGKVRELFLGESAANDARSEVGGAACLVLTSGPSGFGW